MVKSVLLTLVLEKGISIYGLARKMSSVFSDFCIAECVFVF